MTQIQKECHVKPNDWSEASTSHHRQKLPANSKLVRVKKGFLHRFHREYGPANIWTSDLADGAVRQ